MRKDGKNKSPVRVWNCETMIQRPKGLYIGMGCWRRINNDVPRWDSWSMTMDVVDIDVKVR